MDVSDETEEFCPVCFFPYACELWEICGCCGTEFGYDDATATHEELRRQWIAGGCVWWSSTKPPPGWDPQAQLKRRT